MKVPKNVKNESSVSENKSPVSSTLTVGTKFQSLVELKNVFDHALSKGEFYQFYVRDKAVGHYNKQNDRVPS